MIRSRRVGRMGLWDCVLEGVFFRFLFSVPFFASDLMSCWPGLNMLSEVAVLFLSLWSHPGLERDQWWGLVRST